MSRTCESRSDFALAKARAMRYMCEKMKVWKRVLSFDDGDGDLMEKMFEVLMEERAAIFSKNIIAVFFEWCVDFIKGLLNS